MRPLRIVHLLPNRKLCYTSMLELLHPWTIIENEHIQLFLSGEDVMQLVEISDHFEPNQLLELIKMSSIRITVSAIQFKLYLN